MPPQGYTIDSRDLRFCLFELFRAQDLLDRGRFAHLDGDNLQDVLTQAERIAVPARNLLPKPPRLSFEEAAAAPLVFMTAWHALVRRARV